MNKTSVFILIIFLIQMGCISGMTENPEGKYGSTVDSKSAIPLNEITASKGQYLNHEITIAGKITSINEQVGITTFEITGNGEKIKCSTEATKLPKSLEGKDVFVVGILKEIQVSSKKGRDVGGEYSFAADPLGSGYEDELRLEVKGLQVSELGRK